MTTEIIDIRKQHDIHSWKIVFSDNQYECVEYIKINDTIYLTDASGDCAGFDLSDIDNLIQALQKVKEIHERS